MESRGYFGYPNERYPIYGLAVVMDSLPGPEWNYKVTLLRGIEYHLIYDADFGMYGLELDSLYQQDTIDQWANTLIKSCQFEFYRRDQQGEITTESRN